MAMLPQMKLSSFDQVLLGARISKSGQAIPQPGDLESELVASPNSSSEIIELLISRRRP
jgi:cytochrome c-type biogenesis protein CcmH